MSSTLCARFGDSEDWFRSLQSRGSVDEQVYEKAMRFLTRLSVVMRRQYYYEREESWESEVQVQESPGSASAM